MSEHIIDTAMAKRLAAAGAIHGVAIVGQPGGWSVMLIFGKTEKPLGAQRTDKPRLWRSLDRCIEYLKSELHISRVERLDASNHSNAAMGGQSRHDTAERMRRAHEAVGHENWFRAQVEQAIEEADDPNTQWVSNDDAKASWAKKRAELARRIKEPAV